MWKKIEHYKRHFESCWARKKLSKKIKMLKNIHLYTLHLYIIYTIYIYIVYTYTHYICIHFNFMHPSAVRVKSSVKVVQHICIISRMYSLSLVNNFLCLLTCTHVYRVFPFECL